MTDPELVARAIYAVQGAMEGWRDAALAAMSDCRSEHLATEDLVEGSRRVAIGAQVGVDDLEYELKRLESSVPQVQGWVRECADAVEARSATHRQLLDHLTRSETAWAGHLERAQQDRQAAVERVTAAQWEETEALRRLGEAEGRAAHTDPGAEREAALARVQQAGVDYKRALEVRRQAASWEEQQSARVARCGRALSQVRQAAELMKTAAQDLGAAEEALREGRLALRKVDAATDSAHAHLRAMTEAAEEALVHANRAGDHLVTATNEMSEAEESHRRGQVLALDAEYDMRQQIRDLMRFDTAMGGGRGGGSAAPSAKTERARQRTSSRALARNLEASGVPRPPNSAAHHIVAVGARRARTARRILRRHDIDIDLDRAENGVFLPRDRSADNPTGALVHSSVHTNAYYRAVNNLVSDANSREEVLEILSYIRQQLLLGQIPKRRGMR